MQFGLGNPLAIQDTHPKFMGPSLKIIYEGRDNKDKEGNAQCIEVDLKIPRYDTEHDIEDRHV